MRKKIAAFVVVVLFALGILGGIIYFNSKKYVGTVYSVSDSYPNKVATSYEEFKSLIYFGDLQWYTNDMEETKSLKWENFEKYIDINGKPRISNFINVVKNENPMAYNLEYENIQKYKDISNTLYEFMHNLYLNTSINIESGEEYEYIRYILGKSIEPNILELSRKYNEEFFDNQSLAFDSFSFSTGGNLRYEGATKREGKLIIKYNYETDVINTTDTSHWVIVVEVNKNVNKVTDDREGIVYN